MELEELQQSIILKDKEIEDLKNKISLYEEENSKYKNNNEKLKNDLEKSRDINSNLINRFMVKIDNNVEEQKKSFEEEVQNIFK